MASLRSAGRDVKIKSDFHEMLLFKGNQCFRINKHEYESQMRALTNRRLSEIYRTLVLSVIINQLLQVFICAVHIVAHEVLGHIADVYLCSRQKSHEINLKSVSISRHFPKMGKQQKCLILH